MACNCVSHKLPHILPEEYYEINSHPKTCLQVTEKLGQGGFGKVFKVKKQNSNKFYALKNTIINFDQNYEYFLNEINILSQCNHKNIIKYFESWIKTNSKKELYILMELGGESLRIWLNNNRMNERYDILKNNLNPISIFSQIIDGLDYIHNDQKLIHRDLKPDNIMFSLNKKLIKISDFGLTTFSIEKGDKIFGKISSTRIGGTILYLPKNFDEIKNPNEKIDIYALGVILYELTNYLSTEDWENRINKLKENSDLFGKIHFCKIGKNLLAYNRDDRPTLTAIRNNSYLFKT